jgi:hypothetical protein
MKFSKFARQLALVTLMGITRLVTLPILAQEASCTASPALHSAWETSGGKDQVLFEDGQIVLRRGETLSVAKILKREHCKLLVRYQGLRSTWTLERGTPEGTLELKADVPLTLRALATLPPQLDINPRSLAAPRPVSAVEAKTVEEELLRRVGRDQEALKNPAWKEKRAEIVAENHQYLQDLTQKIGWIDIPRFGKSAASAAILLAKHSGDLLLMKAALPFVEIDVKKHGGAGEMFSVLYDELQLELGNQQRYGTQVDTDKEGHPYILPLEDPTKVDEYRKEIGILSFEEYRKMASDGFNKGVLIRVAGNNE